MKKVLLTLTLMIGFITVGFSDDPPPFNPDQPASIPVDGGAIFLLAAATSYGATKLKSEKKETNKA